MTTGANFKVSNGRMLWHRPLITGDELLVQDHEARAHARQGTYKPYPEYGNPFVLTMTSEISQTERNMLLVSNMKECSVQDVRFIDCIVDENTIVEEENTILFDYLLIKADGGTIEFRFGEPTIEEPEEPGPPEILFYNLITEETENFITEDGQNFISEWQT